MKVQRKNLFELFNYVFSVLLGKLFSVLNILKTNS